MAFTARAQQLDARSAIHLSVYDAGQASDYKIAWLVHPFAHAGMGMDFAACRPGRQLAAGDSIQLEGYC